MKKITILAATAASLALAACGSPAEETTADVATTDVAMADQMANDDAAAGTVVQVAQGNPDFSTLATAVQSAGLVDTLSGAGPYTVFAPTNAAFEEVPQATREELLSPAGQQELSNILTYHVVPGETNAAALTQAITSAGAEGYTLTTVNGETLTATLEGGNVILTDAAGNTATVTQTDIEASNGVVHAIDGVLMPQ